MAAFVGLVDGLVRRDVRGFGAGRESGFVYHRARASLMPLAVLPWVTYLALPVSVHPLLILLPSAALLGVAVASRGDVQEVPVGASFLALPESGGDRFRLIAAPEDRRLSIEPSASPENGSKPAQSCAASATRHRPRCAAGDRQGCPPPTPTTRGARDARRGDAPARTAGPPPPRAATTAPQERPLPLRLRPAARRPAARAAPASRD
jgi:hypothetical protein